MCVASVVYGNVFQQHRAMKIKNKNIIEKYFNEYILISNHSEEYQHPF